MFAKILLSKIYCRSPWKEWASHLVGPRSKFRDASDLSLGERARADTSDRPMRMKQGRRWITMRAGAPPTPNAFNGGDYKFRRVFRNSTVVDFIVWNSLWNTSCSGRVRDLHPWIPCFALLFFFLVFHVVLAIHFGNPYSEEVRCDFSGEKRSTFFVNNFENERHGTETIRESHSCIPL